MRQRWIAELRVMAPRLMGTLGASGISAVLGLVTGTVAARVLGPSMRGELAQLLLWPQLFATLGVLGIELAATYLSADPVRRRNVPATSLVLVLALSCVLVPLYMALVPVLFADGAIRREALLMAALIPMYLVGAVCIDVLAGELRFGAFNAVRLALPAIYCGSLVVAAATGSLTSTSGALAYLTAHGAGDALALALVWGRGGLGVFDGALARDALRFGLRAHFGRLTPQALGVDAAILALALSSRDVGLYAAATAFLAAPSLVASSISMVVYPHVSASHQAGERPQLQATFILYAGAVIALSGALALLAGPVVTAFFGSAYADAAPALRFLALASVAIALRAFPIEVLRGVGRPGLTSIAEVASWALFFALVPAGAALGGLEGTSAAVAGSSWLSLAALGALVWWCGLLGSAGAAPVRGEPAEVAA